MPKREHSTLSVVFCATFGILWGGPHRGGPTRIRFHNRLLGSSGARICWFQAGQPVGVSDVVAGMFLPDNGGNPQQKRVFKRCTQATFRLGLDENTGLWMITVGLCSVQAEGGRGAPVDWVRCCARSLHRWELPLRLCPETPAPVARLLPLLRETSAANRSGE